MGMVVWRPVTPGMRRMLLVASALVFIIGFPLFLLSGNTARFFAWTINPTLTAAFLGAAYWASFLLEFLASRERYWAHARVAVPAVFAFSTLTLLVTLLHIDRFHLASTLAPETRFVTWVWIIVYALVPPILLALWILQSRQAGEDPPPQLPIPPWAQAVTFGQAALLLITGVALLIAPLRIADLWPWQITALTGRAIGAWCIGIGIAVGQVGWEGDWRRVRAGTVAIVTFGVLELIVLVRYAGSVSWGDPVAWFYVAFLLSLLAIGGYGVAQGRKARANEVVATG